VKSNTVAVYAGNEAPDVSIVMKGNRSFYFPGTPVQYAVSIKDGSDTATVDPQNLFVSVDYVEGFDKAAVAMGHQQGQASIEGKSLVMSLDCKSCHKEAEKSIGPAYRDVAKKYGNDPKAKNYLAEKIIRGGAGVWGEVAMPAHPTLSQSDVHQITSWILSLENKAVAKKSLPMSGVITPPSTADAKKTMVLTASYTDKGGKKGKALTGNRTLSLAGSMLSFIGSEKKEGFTAFALDGGQLLIFPEKEGWFAIDGIDLTGVGAVTLNMGWREAPKTSAAFEVRLDAPGGKLLGSGRSTVAAKGQQGGQVTVPLAATSDGKMHTLYIIYKSSEAVQGGVMGLQFKPAR
jgi:cytochrome c551/c552